MKSEQNQIHFEPEDILIMKSDKWGKLWDATQLADFPGGLPHPMWELSLKLEELKPAARLAATQASPITGKQIQRSAKRLDPNRSLGLDFWSPNGSG